MTAERTAGKDDKSLLEKMKITEENEKEDEQALSLSNQIGTLSVKNKADLDPEVTFASVHIYCDGNLEYFFHLGLPENPKPYYKVQLLESDTYCGFWMFRFYAPAVPSPCTPIPPVRPDSKSSFSELLPFQDDLDRAIAYFSKAYEELTGNTFGTTPFVHHPGKYYDMNINRGNIVQTLKDEVIAESQLAPQVQDLISLLFNVDMMKKTAAEFHLSSQRMPLNKLKSKLIYDAMDVLKEISEIIKGNGSLSQLSEISKLFYTMIPHDIGAECSLIIDSTEGVTEKAEILQSLFEIDVAFRLFNTEIGGRDSHKMDPIDRNYEKLETYIEPLDRGSDEFKLLSKYASNTHYATDIAYKIEVDEIFKISRKHEAYRYREFRHLHKKLLWHGSRLSNFIGILSHGLKIPPHQLSHISHRFSKGIYFTDMAAVAAECCAPSISNNIGLILACEVALGNSLELETLEIVEKLPDNKHSVKGIGRIFPNPDENYKRWDSINIPLGSPVEDESVNSDFRYNEYIVYNEGQLKLQYLFKIRFNYNCK